jgi:hypothetical protein
MKSKFLKSWETYSKSLLSIVSIWLTAAISFASGWGDYNSSSAGQLGQASKDTTGNSPSQLDKLFFDLIILLGIPLSLLLGWQVYSNQLKKEPEDEAKAWVFGMVVALLGLLLDYFISKKLGH